MDHKHQMDIAASHRVLKLIKTMETPLASIVQASTVATQHTSQQLILSNSKEIQNIIDEIVNSINKKQQEPLFFQLYVSNPQVQAICTAPVTPHKITKDDATWLCQLEREVFKNIKNQTINLFDLSYKLAVSERQLHRKVKKLLHLTPNKYIRVLRLHKAKQLIDTYTYDTIAQLSYAVGYYDAHYFSKLFYQQYGISPKELLTF